MIYFLLLTAFSVSIDSMVCGFSLSLLKPKKLPIVFIITLVVYIMCIIANYFALFFSQHIPENFSGFGGIILAGIGFYNLLKKEKKAERQGDFLKQTLLSGFAVGLDGAVANLSLSLMGINFFYVPITIAIFHGIMIYIGVSLPDIPLVSKLSKYSFIAPLILIALGLYKFCGVFL